MTKSLQLSKITITFLLIAFFTNLSAQQIFINEFLASNSNINTDEFGENDDWVELYNPSSSSVNIGGYFFTDDLINTTKWMIPTGTTIPGNGFLLIWCDDQENQGPLHTSFKLSSGGEDLALVAADATTIIDSYTFGPQTANVSLGRQNDGSANWIFFGEPTPEETNNSGTSVAVMPVASENGGHYNNAITVSLTTTTQGATIRYTLDGSDPTSSSSFYSGSIDIDETTVLRARAFRSGMDPSRTMTHTYLYDIDHTMPIFCVSTDDDNFFGSGGIYTLWDDDIEMPAHVELYEADGSFGFRQDLGVQVHGGFSQSYPHKGISFVAKNEYGNNKINYPLFPDLPFTEYGSFILRASGNDWSKTLFRDALASGLAREFEDVKPLIKDPDLEYQEYRPAIVYLNGAYFGIHNLREKLDWRYLKTHYDIEKEEADIVQRENSLEHGNLDAWTEYRDFIEDADFTDPNDLAELKTWIDLDHFVDYFLIQIFVDNNDWPDNNNKGWRLRQEGSRWRYFLYDMDRGFGLIPLSGDYNSGDWESQSLEMVMAPTQTESHNKEWSTLLLRKLMLNDAFRLKWINRMADQLNIMYTPERLIGRIDEYEDVYTPEIAAHAEKWWDNNYYATNVNRARIFAENRTDEMWNQFDDFFDIITDVANIEVDASPEAGGVVHLNTMNFREGNFPWTGKYFQGVDVPLYAAPNPGYIFTGWFPSTLGNNAVTTMNLDGDENITANFVLGSTQIGNIVINEINYHSPDTSICDAGDWVELYNAGTEAVDLSGWFLEDGSGNYFSIPANTILGGQGYLVLVEDAIRFQNIHPTINNFIAGFGNSITGSMGLSNGGEWISINNANRSFMDTVHYDDKLPWPVAADGDGPTLQLINPSLDNALAENWIAATTNKGTPGEPFQGTLYLGENTVLCSPDVISLDANYEGCFGCTYNWNTSQTSAVISVSPNTGMNVYAVTVTDSGGITQTDEVTVELSVPFDLTHTQQNLDCFGDNDGSIDLSISNANSYTYLWTTGATTQDVTNLSFGSYTVTVSDALFCSQTKVINIGAPPALISSSQTTEIDCYGELGAIDISVSGGAVPYSYAWSNGATTQDLSGLSEATYIVTISDTNGCTRMLDFELEEPNVLTGDFDTENGCNGLANGFIDADIDGGTSPYLFSWSNGVVGSSDDIENLSAGVYGLTVTDDNGCTWASSTEILVSSSISGNANITNTSCIGESTGSIDLQISGGTTPYSYYWNTGATTSMVQNLIDGDYMITVTDSIGCQYYETFTVSAPNPVLATANINEITCAGANDASILINPTGGNGMYNYAWSNGAGNTSIVSNLTNGNYSLTVTDGNNCSATYNYTITQPQALTANTQTIPVICNGDASGTAIAIATGGSGNYNYLWNTNSTNSEISNLIAGTYTVTITDTNNCTSTQSAIISENNAIANTISQNNLTCNNSPTGSISINTSGGQQPYNYNWNNNATSATINDLAAATYTVTISDNNDCTSVETVTITEPSAISASIIQNNIDCNGTSEGSLTVTPSGGEGPYTFVWSTGSNANEITNQPAGDYVVTITDNNNCTLVETGNISQPNAISSTLSTTNVSCNGMNDGQASISPDGGVGSYTYLWSNNANTQIISNLSSGVYTVTLTDAAGCSQVESVSITEPTAINNSHQSTPVNCNDEENGAISLNTTGGTGDYNYQWNNGDNTAQLEDLPAGTYIVTISDSQDCSLIESIVLTNPSPISSMAGADNVTCFEGSNGSIQLSTSGGAGSYQYIWNNNQSGANINNLTAGNYTVTISDNNNCTETLTTTISAPDLIEVNVQVIAADCSGAANALIDLSPTGGTGAFTYSWSTGATSPDLDNIGEGNYTVTITDANNCSIIESILVSEPSALVTQFTATNVSCFGESNGTINVSVSGGEGPYDYSWNTGQTSSEINNLVAASYIVTISDNNGCTNIQTIEVTEPAVLNYSGFQLINNNCFSGSNGLIGLNATGGSGNYSYQWNTGSLENSISNLPAGNYGVTITDGNNCTFSESFVITEQPDIEVTSSVQAITCFNEGNGSIQLNITGGTGIYFTSWSNGDTTQLIENLQQGIYSVTVTDELACTSVQSISLNQPSELEADISVVPVTCHSEANGSISLNISGGTDPFQYIWNNGFEGPNPDNLAAGDYSVTIIDANECVQTQFITLSEPAMLEAAFGQVNNDCFDGNTGSLDATVQGGTMPYSYLWSTGETVSIIENLSAADYSVTIIDDNECAFEESFTVTQSSMIEAVSEVTNVSCFGGTDGAINLELQGGTPGYQVDWSNGASGETNTDLPSGTYTATIMDLAGCQTVVTYSINEAEELMVTEEFMDASNSAGGSITISPTGGTAPYSIQWDNGETNFAISGLESGVYNYIVTDVNGCLVEGSISLVNVAVSEIAKGELNIYPNPTNGIVNIQSDFSEMGITVMDVLGRTLLQEQQISLSSNSPLSLDLSGFHTGVYFLKIEADGRERVERIVVE